MSGTPRRHIRRLAEEAAAEAARLEAEGDPAAPAARKEADRLAALTEKVYADVRTSPPKQKAPAPAPLAADRVRKMKAVRLVGAEAACRREMGDPGSVASEAGALAAEIAVAGVRPGFCALPPPGTPPPLSDGEFAVARAVVVTSAGDADARLSDESLPPDRWLAEAFPVLPPDDRVRCARFLAVMASSAAESPSGMDSGSTVAERALSAAGLSYTAFESARSREVQFDTAQSVVTAARKRAVMNLLEETLWRRAFDGQEDDALTRDGSVVPVRKHDNTLAFNLLKYGHDQYARQMVKDKASANAMTLMISNGYMPEMLKAKEPKAIEAEEVNRG